MGKRPTAARNPSSFPARRRGIAGINDNDTHEDLSEALQQAMSESLVVLKGAPAVYRKEPGVLRETDLGKHVERQHAHA
jgi:hypothetical protein